VFAPPRDDPLGERGADAGQPGDVAHVSAIDVDALARQERTSKLSGSAGRLA
jgi:hypothetical protein